MNKGTQLQAAKLKTSVISHQSSPARLTANDDDEDGDDDDDDDDLAIDLKGLNWFKIYSSNNFK